jgi:hypothetical protein
MEKWKSRMTEAEQRRGPYALTRGGHADRSQSTESENQ